MQDKLMNLNMPRGLVKLLNSSREEWISLQAQDVILDDLSMEELDRLENIYHMMFEMARGRRKP